MTMTAEQPNIDLTPHDWELVRDILAMCIPGCEVWAFGSRAKWSAKPYSDLDIAIVSEHALPIATMAELREAFDGSDLTIKVDLVDWATTSEPFRRIIQESRVVLQRGR